jgi:hypothetical protein
MALNAQNVQCQPAIPAVACTTLLLHDFQKKSAVAGAAPSCVVHAALADVLCRRPSWLNPTIVEAW